MFRGLKPEGELISGLPIKQETFNNRQIRMIVAGGSQKETERQ
jgi:hypothetical protein